MGRQNGQDPQKDDGELLADSPYLQVALLVWTVGIFAIAIVLAYSGLVEIGLLVLAAGLLLAVFAFWEAIVELARWLRAGGKGDKR